MITTLPHKLWTEVSTVNQPTRSTTKEPIQDITKEPVQRSNVGLILDSTMLRKEKRNWQTYQQRKEGKRIRWAKGWV